MEPFRPSGVLELINTISSLNQRAFAETKRILQYQEDNVYQSIVCQIKNSPFHALEWITLREKVCKVYGKDQWSSKIDEIVRNNLTEKKDAEEKERYFNIAHLCNKSRISHIEGFLQPFREIEIEDDVIDLAAELSRGYYYFGGESCIPPEKMTDREVVAILRALSGIKQENRKDVLEQSTSYIEDYYMDYGSLKKDMSGFVVASLLQAINEGCNEDDIRDAIEKTKTLTENGYIYWGGHDKDFIKGILTIPAHEREFFVKACEENKLIIRGSDEYRLNSLIFFYLTPNHLRGKEVYEAFDKENLLTLEFQKAFVISLSQRLDQGISRFVKAQFIEFITALRLPEGHLFTQILGRLEL